MTEYTVTLQVVIFSIIIQRPLSSEEDQMVVYNQSEVVSTLLDSITY